MDDAPREEATPEQKPVAEPEPVITSQRRNPCGCHVTEYSNGLAQVQPCLPCGMMMVAKHLRDAAQALVATAGVLRQNIALGEMNQIKEASRAAMNRKGPHL